MYSCYAIRIKNTHKYLPRTRTNMSNSASEPEFNGGRYGIRLFATKRAAVNALTAWCMGVWYMEHEDDCAYPAYNHKNTRYRHDMEIVKFNLMEEISVR